MGTGSNGLSIPYHGNVGERLPLRLEIYQWKTTGGKVD
eukprot:COSAG02_NODE_24629_length_682_cov_0.842196_1_plen_37_part_01